MNLQTKKWAPYLEGKFFTLRTKETNNRIRTCRIVWNVVAYLEVVDQLGRFRVDLSERRLKEILELACSSH